MTVMAKWMMIVALLVAPVSQAVSLCGYASGEAAHTGACCTMICCGSGCPCAADSEDQPEPLAPPVIVTPNARPIATTLELSRIFTVEPVDRPAFDHPMDARLDARDGPSAQSLHCAWLI